MFCFGEFRKCNMLSKLNDSLSPEPFHDDTLKELCDLVGISSEYVKEEELCTPTKRLKSEHPYNSCCLYSPESTSSCDQLKTQFENKVCNINENIPKVTI